MENEALSESDSDDPCDDCTNFEQLWKWYEPQKVDDDGT